MSTNSLVGEHVSQCPVCSGTEPAVSEPCIHGIPLIQRCGECYEISQPKFIQVQIPIHLSLNRAELQSMKLRLSELIGERAKKMGMGLDAGESTPELDLLNELWDLLNRMVGL